MSKGISPIIATVLLIAMVMSVSLIASSFFPDLMTQLTDQTSEDTEKVSLGASANIDITTASYNSLSESMTISVQNGQTPLDSNFTVSVFCENGGAVQTRFGNMTKGQLRTVNANVSKCPPQRVEVSSNKYSVYAETDRITRVDTGAWIHSISSDFEEVAKNYERIFFGSIRLAMDKSTVSESSSFTGTKINVTEDSGVLRLET